MPYEYGFGRGYGFRGSSPPWPYVGRGRGGRPRCGYFGASAAVPYAPDWVPNPGYSGAWDAPYYGRPRFYSDAPYATQASREEELEYLKGEATAVKAQLEEIEARIKSLERE